MTEIYEPGCRAATDRDEAECTPVELDATQLGAYVAACRAEEGT